MIPSRKTTKRWPWSSAAWKIKKSRPEAHEWVKLLTTDEEYKMIFIDS